MKILFFSPYFHPYTSGITTYPYKLFSHLTKKHEVTILTFQHEKDLPPQENIEGFTVIRIPYLFKISKGFISPQSLIYFWNESKKADIIFLNIPNFEGFPLAIFAKVLGKTLYSIFHCLVYLDKSIFSQIISFFLNLSVYFQLAMSKTIVAYTEDYANHTWVSKNFRNKIKTALPPIKKFNVDKEKIEDFLSMKKNKIWIGYAGRTSKEKGLEYLINSVDNLRKTNKNIEMVFAGPYGKDVVGEEKYYDKLITLMKEKNISYHFFGCLNGDKLGAFYKSINVLALSSINSTEAFGMVQAEAMVLGTPVVCSNLPGVRMPIKMTGMGIVVEPQEINGLTNALNEILTNREKYSNKDLQQNAEKLFNIENTWKFYEELIKQN